MIAHYHPGAKKRIVELRFPTISDFEIDHYSLNVTPVKYYAGKGRDANEYPPVVSWRIGNARYRYVLKPSFKTEVWKAFLYSSKMVHANYDTEEEKLWKILQWSVDGKTADEINLLLGNT